MRAKRPGSVPIVSQEPPVFGLLDHLDAKVEELRKLAPEALSELEIEAVHDARVRTRRLKAAIEMLEPILSGRGRKAVLKATKKLRRRLGPVRDLDVMIGHMSEIAGKPEAAAWLLERLHDARRREGKSAKRRSAPSRILARLGAWWGVRQDLIDARDAVDTLLAERVNSQLDLFDEQAQRLIGTAAAKPADPTTDHEAPARSCDPHALRIAGKSLRYTLELAEAHGRALPAKVLSSFKNIQDALGLWHDFVILSEHMLRDSIECELALHDPDLLGQILALAQTTLKKAQSELKRAGDLWTKRGPDLSAAVRGAFPLVRPAAHEGTMTSGESKRIGVDAALDEGDAGQNSGKSLAKAGQGAALALGVESADDANPGGSGGQSVVVSHLAGEIKARAAGDDLIEQAAAGAGADGDASDPTLDRSGDENVG
jgi:CHAD domain-containing protein